METLRSGSKWRHKNGCDYLVIGLANEATLSEANYPVTVIYQGDNGLIWARPLSTWKDSFTECEEEFEVVEPNGVRENKNMATTASQKR